MLRTFVLCAFCAMNFWRGDFKLWAFGLCFEHLGFEHSMLWTLEEETWGLVKVWMCEWFRVWASHIPPPFTLFTIYNFFAFRTSHACCYWSYRVCHLLLPLEFFLLSVVFLLKTLDSMFIFFFTLNPSSSNIVYLPKIKSPN